MAAAFSRLPVKVLWRLLPSEVPDAAALARLGLGNNTRVRHFSCPQPVCKRRVWSTGAPCMLADDRPRSSHGCAACAQVVTQMPQNDLLAHSQTRAFVFQGGVYSQYEAVYHGKPVVVMPFFAGAEPSLLHMRPWKVNLVTPRRADREVFCLTCAQTSPQTPTALSQRCDPLTASICSTGKHAAPVHACRGPRCDRLQRPRPVLRSGVTLCSRTQGYGVRVDPRQAGTPAFEAAILKVLTDPKYGQAARALSVRVRARKDTPLQEAGGASADPKCRTLDGVASLCMRAAWELVCACIHIMPGGCFWQRSFGMIVP